MDFELSIAAQAAARWQERAVTRENNRSNLEDGNITAVESFERIKGRINHLTEVAMQPRASVPSRPVTPLTDSFALERVLGKDDLLDINFLEHGLAVARFVGRVNIRTRSGQTVGYGTGFMVSPRLLITNNHVFPSADSASNSLIEFDYQEDRYGRLMPVRSFNLETNTFFMTSKQLDFSLVAVHPTAADGTELKFYAWTNLVGTLGKALLGDSLNIIQHPLGEVKHIALRSNRLIDLFDTFAHYETDTQPGSSGSPVYNDQWEIIALHHSGVPKMVNGQYIAQDGSIWKSGMDPEKLDWVANEGIRVSSLVEYLKKQKLTGDPARLRDDLLNLQPPNPVEVAQQHDETLKPAQVPAAPVSGAAGQTVTIDGGSFTITIPLQVSFKLGTADTPTQLTPTASPTPVASTAPDNQPASADLTKALADLEDNTHTPYYDEAADLQARQAYYTGLRTNVRPATLYKRLNALLTRTHTTQPVYKPMLEVYPWVDLHETPNGRKIISIYSGVEFDPQEFIEADFRVDQERQRVLESQLQESTYNFISREVLADALEASLPYNCEHSVPQSWFGKKEPMRGDLHHLFALESGCNSFRGNTPYYAFSPVEEVVREDCGRREAGKFEPDAGKGSIARAVFYFLLRYPGEINRTASEYTPDRLAMLLQWHKDHPVERYELHRNQCIFLRQGNRNPLIDHPEWAEKIDFTKGLGL